MAIDLAHVEKHGTHIPCNSLQHVFTCWWNTQSWRIPAITRVLLCHGWAVVCLVGERDFNLWCDELQPILHGTWHIRQHIRHDADGAWLWHMAGKCPFGEMDALWLSIWHRLIKAVISVCPLFAVECCLCWVLRDLQPTEKLLFLSKLAQQLAEQLYGEGCNCNQLPVETSRPLSVAMFFNCQLPAKNTHTHIYI